MRNFKRLNLVSILLIPLFSFSQNVGIGVVLPTEALSVSKGLNIDDLNQNPGLSMLNALRFGNTPNTAQMVGISSNRAGASPFSLDFYTASQRRMVILQNGFVGINIVPTSYLLEVGGSIKGTSLISQGSIFAEGGSVNAANAVNAGTNVSADNSITAANNITAIAGDIVATAGELRADGRGVVMSNNAARQKVVAYAATLSVAGLPSGSSVTGSLAISPGTFTLPPTAYVGNILSENGDYFKAMLVLENVTTTNITIRVVNVTSSPITFTNAQWRILAIGSF